MPSNSLFRLAACLAFPLLSAAPAQAQLQPLRAYYGIGRSIPMSVTIPAGAEAEPVIQLIASRDGSIAATAAVVPGVVDLAGLFPVLWDPPRPPVKESLFYAQLAVGGEQVGPPVVLQPLVDPPQAVFIDLTTQEPQYRDGRGAYSGLRAYVERHVVLETTHGEIEFRLRPDQAPNTVWNFMGLVEGGFYTDIIFHRVKAVRDDGAAFVVQAGDPVQGRGKPGDGGPGYSINLERSNLPHDFGVISMARTTMPNSAGSQFFICLSREGTMSLDGKYAAFGEAVSGGDVIRRIAASEVDNQDRPLDPPLIKRARLVDAPPFARRTPPLSTSPEATQR